MTEDIPPLPQYAFMAWWLSEKKSRGKTLLFEEMIEKLK
jgi:hypothetical protein